MTTTLTEILFGEHCIACGVLFGIEQHHNDQLRESHKAFYCPNGHSMVYGGESNKTKAERLEWQLKQNEESLARALSDGRTYRNEAFTQREKRLKLEKRIKNGVCPHCTRSFQNLKRHIACKHKDK
jgi:hypothetical protein